MRNLSIRKADNGHQFYVETEGKIEKVFYSFEQSYSYIKKQGNK